VQEGQILTDTKHIKSSLPQLQFHPTSRSQSPLASVPAAKVNPREFPCERGCHDKKFKSDKDRARHYKSAKHRSAATPLYTCRCGAHFARKDKYLPHLRSLVFGGRHRCAHRYSGAVLHFSCICRSEPRTADRIRHLRHVENCEFGKRKPGRRRCATDSTRESQGTTPYLGT
jgi:hypothetical protein